MGDRDYATYGSNKTYNVYCHRCGTKYKANECVIETDLMGRGLYVCRASCFDGEHPQDFVRGVPDRMTVPYASPNDGSIPSIDSAPPFDPTTQNLI